MKIGDLVNDSMNLRSGFSNLRDYLKQALIFYISFWLHRSFERWLGVVEQLVTHQLLGLSWVGARIYISARGPCPKHRYTGLHTSLRL